MVDDDMLFLYGEECEGLARGDFAAEEGCGIGEPVPAGFHEFGIDGVVGAHDDNVVRGGIGYRVLSGVAYDRVVRWTVSESETVLDRVTSEVTQIALLGFVLGRGGKLSSDEILDFVVDVATRAGIAVGSCVDRIISQVAAER